MNRRAFLKSAVSRLRRSTSCLPSRLCVGAGGSSDTLNVALIGCGTQGRTARPAGHAGVRVVLCDPNKDSDDYVDWSRQGLRKGLANAIGVADWRAGQAIPGGRDVAAEVVDAYYARHRAGETAKPCARYADFRELLEKERGVHAVKIMTPDHLHASVAIAAMRAGRHVMLHKPLANRVIEVRRVIETARETGVATHFIPASSGGDISISAQLIRNGVIGRLREIHNWSNRPVWPQYPERPSDTPPVPKDFDWALWLGPSRDCPYHPHYTHTVFAAGTSSVAGHR